MTILELAGGRLFWRVMLPVAESPTIEEAEVIEQIIVFGVMATRPVLEKVTPPTEAITGKLVA